LQEREAEKIAEEAAALREVKTELPAARSPESWRGNAYYRHLDVLKGEQEIRRARASFQMGDFRECLPPDRSGD
jgi:hypothetical protein